MFIVTGICGCSVVNRQYYYTTTAPHTFENGDPRYYRITYNKFNVNGPLGAPAGSVTTSNGFGRPLFTGPLYVPFIPVGLVTLFVRNETRFILDVRVESNDGYFGALNLDSTAYKAISDSINALHNTASVRLNTVNCYLLVNGSKKIPLQVREDFSGDRKVCGYHMFADVGFSKVRAFKIVTGNALLDSTLKDVTFRRNSRITYNLISTL